MQPSATMNKRTFPFVETPQEQRPAKRQKRNKPLEPFASGTAMMEVYVSVHSHVKHLLLLYVRKTPADIAFIRARLFYSRPRLVPHTNQIIVGLPDKRKLFCQHT
jgi:hypothetical protein